MINFRVFPAINVFRTSMKDDKGFDCTKDMKVTLVFGKKVKKKRKILLKAQLKINAFTHSPEIIIICCFQSITSNWQNHYIHQVQTVKNNYH